MPAIAAEVDAALEEGVELQELALPLQIEGTTLTCARMVLNARHEPVRTDEQFTVECDRVILALGQSADASIVPGDAKLFSGGDFAQNEGTVAAAIGSGRNAALHIHRELSHVDLLKNEEPPPAPSEIIRQHLFAHSPRARTATLSPGLRRHTFAEVHCGIDDAKTEATRCFSCGVCNACDRCVTYCPEGVLIGDGDTYRFNYDYCKGCGVCASECPRGVIVMSEI